MDNWIKKKIGFAEETLLTRELLEAYQLDKIIRTLRLAKENSFFYTELLKDVNIEEFRSLSDIRKVPFTFVDDLRERGREMLCVPQSEISRIVTLDTSGTTGRPKRVYYTQEDQELTIDFFHHGMMSLIDENDGVLILLPCARPGSVGDLLDMGIQRLGAKTVPYGLLNTDYSDIPDVLKDMCTKGVTSVVGSPTQVFELANASIHLSMEIKSVLLSTEYVPETICNFLSRTWNCKVFEHYGMTEMGLGGAVSCWTLKGYHPREADLYFEIIDPTTGEVVPDGEFGEVVFTTLTRNGMPFIRYRTRDWSRWLTDQCPCGSILKKLDKVRDRGIVKRNSVLL